MHLEGPVIKHRPVDEVRQIADIRFAEKIHGKRIGLLAVWMFKRPQQPVTTAKPLHVPNKS
jgi:hypothetical protein